jgi:Type ISP C-terminal specificity domain/N-6 DNA Methylase
MSELQKAVRAFSDDVVPLAISTTTREESYYPAIRNLSVAILKSLGLSAEVRTSTSERRTGGGIDLPDVALYDGSGDFILVCGEVKLPNADLLEIAMSTERNDQIGRYLARTRVVLLCNIRGFGLLTVDPNFAGSGPVPPAFRRLEQVVELWSSATDLRRGRTVSIERVEQLADLIEMAVTRYAPIAEPETLARILARQARRAKADLPQEFSQAVRGLMDDFGAALGITFEDEEGEEFFRSSLVQTVYYGLFAGWILWSKSRSTQEFRWRDLATHLRIPFLGELFHEIQHPRRIAELGLVSHLDIATETLSRVHSETFFERLTLPSLGVAQVVNHSVATAIVYFYEPFLETFDPELRKQLGVWYTPPEIVRYQVRKVDALLRNELGCALGFADENVVVLDPACGTGAYLIEVLHCMADTLRGEGIEAELGDTLLRALCQRVLGFEILTAPFVIAHLQLHLLLFELGTEPGHDQRPAVFLTNALTGWRPGAQLILNFPELQAERDASQAVKTDARIIVVLGNPPYNRFAGAPIEEELALIDPYKGIRRRDDGRQIGSSELFTRWRIRKHLLDDLYIRFFRLAEERIGQVAEHGVVSFISNSSYLAGRSHPIMRESLCRSFQEMWIDNLNGDKYKTGKVIPQGLPGEGTADQSIFSTEQDPRGIQVGTAITTLLKRRNAGAGIVAAHYRDFWGHADDKRASLLASLIMSTWRNKKQTEAADKPSGPRRYQTFVPEERRRWKLIPYDIVGGFEDWFSLEDLFPIHYQGVNPNRGLEGSIVETDRRRLEERMRDYYSDMSDEEFCQRHPVLCEDRADYVPSELRAYLRENSGFSEQAIVPYIVFPLDVRYVYYETAGNLLNRRRPELWKNLNDNEFLVAVPEPRRISESRPLLANSLFDLHLHDRGSVGFPATLLPPVATQGTLFQTEAPPHANLTHSFWRVAGEEWGEGSDLSSDPAKAYVRKLFRVCLALCHAPQYEEEHRESLAQAWAHVPIPRDRELFEELAGVGDLIATLLNPLLEPRSVIRATLGGYARRIAMLSSTAGTAVREDDLVVAIPHFGAARGGWRTRQFETAEVPPVELGQATGDLYINEHIFFRNVPESVWRYELGGYPVLKKWLGYRDARRRENRPLTLPEKDHFRSMVQRIAALISLRGKLNELYERAAANAWIRETTETGSLV